MMKDRLLAYLRERVNANFGPQDRLLDFLDSVAILQLVLFIEQELGISLDMSQLDLEVFATLDSLADVVLSQASAAGAAAEGAESPGP